MSREIAEMKMDTFTTIMEIESDAIMIMVNIQYGLHLNTSLHYTTDLFQ